MSSKALTNSQIMRAALIVLLGFLASGVLGVVRTGVFAAAFGTSAELDAFYAAQRIPEMLFALVAGGALGSSFIPVFSRYLTDDDLDHAWKLASSVMTISALTAIVLGTVIAVLAPLIVPNLLFPGRPPEQQALATSLTQLMLITTVLFSISGLIMGILNAHQNFIFPAIALSMNNIGLIIGALFLAPNMPAYDGQVAGANVYGLALGAILGASFHLLVQLPGLFKLKAYLRPLIDWRIEGVREILTLMAPRVLGLAVVQINFGVNVMFASSMIEGSLVALNVAWYLMFFSLGIIAQSIGTAVFPSLSALVAENDIDGYRLRLASAMRGVLFLALPASIGLIVLGMPIVSIFERAEWTVESTQATAWALGFFALGIAGHGLLEVLSRAFYALADTWTPVKIGILAMISNIVLSYVFIQFIGEPDSLVRGPFAGLALANSLTTILESMILWWLLKQRIHGLNDRYILDGAGRALTASIGMGIVLLIVQSFMEGYHTYLQLMAGLAIGGVSFGVFAIVLRIDELDMIIRRFKLR